MKNVKRVPALRFPEFEGKWEEQKFSEIVKINQGLQIPISDRYLEEVENSYFYITNEFLKKNSDKKYFIKNPPKSVLCDEDDILMTRTGNTGMVVTNVKGAFHNNFFKIAYPEFVNKNFLFYFLNLRSTQIQIIKLAGTSTIPDLNHSDFYRIKFKFPPLPEQQKIATFLTTVDDKTQALKKKKNLLEQYKKGIMQQIFSQAIRFKDENGKMYGKWEEKRLGEICSFFSGGTPQSSNKLFYSGDIPFIGSGNISDNSVSQFITKEALEKSSAKMIEVGDLLYALYGATSGEVAISKMKGAINQAVLCIRTTEDRNYLYQLLSFSKGVIVRKFIQGGQGNLSAKIVKELKFNFPPLPEQTKIANFLTSIDKKIEQVQAQIRDTEVFKKGLLQQMFV